MKRIISKSFLIYCLTIALVSSVIAYGADFDCSDYSSVVEDPGQGNAYAILYLVCPLKGAINLGLLLVGATLIIFILYGAIKAVQSQGDPKMLEGAKQTWSWAIFGALIILVSITAVGIIYGLLGSSLSPLDILGNLRKALEDLYSTFY